MIVFTFETQQQIEKLAAKKGLEAEAYVLSLIRQDAQQSGVPFLPLNGNGQADDDYDPDAGRRAVAALINRTPEQIKAAQEWAIKEFQAERELPEGASSIFDVIPVIRGNETDEQVLADLEKLS